MAKKQNLEVSSPKVEEVFTPEEQEQFEVELKKEKQQTVNEELFGMIKKMEAMYARCGQIEKESPNKFAFVMQNNLRACLSKINMFAKNV